MQFRSGYTLVHFFFIILLKQYCLSKPHFEVFMSKMQKDVDYRSQPCGEGFWIDGATVQAYPLNLQQSILSTDGTMVLNTHKQTFTQIIDHTDNSLIECRQTFKARREGNSLKLKVEYFNEHSYYTCSSSLSVYRVERIDTNEPVLVLRGTCQTDEDGSNDSLSRHSNIVLSESGVFVLVYKTYYQEEINRGFRITMTSFNEGVKNQSRLRRRRCSIFEFECNNGHCIDDDLVCDGVDHCFDKSDESLYEYRNCRSPMPQIVRAAITLSTNKGIMITVIVLSVILLVLLFTAVIIYNKPSDQRCRSNRNYGLRSSSTQESNMINLRKLKTKIDAV